VNPIRSGRLRAVYSVDFITNGAQFTGLKDMSFGTTRGRLESPPTFPPPMNLRDVKLSSRSVIPVALAIPRAPTQPRPRPVVVAVVVPRDPKPEAPEDRVRSSANCPNYWL